jgi:cytochrome c biogenesis protein CcmG/thiol:disulfide interchange protein DsbE
MKRLAIWIGVVVLLLILSLGLFRTQRGQLGPGDNAPDFELVTFSGERYRLSDYQGSVVVINFWASWCESCKPEAKDLEAAYKYYQPKGEVLFLGIDYLDTEPEALEYLEVFQVTYPNGPDLQTRISQKFRVRGVPETYILNQEGKIVFVKIGPFSSLEEIKSIVDPLLGL